MKKWLSIVVVASWPIWFIVSYLNSTTPVAGQRWSEANPGRAGMLSLTGAVWASIGVAILFWKFVVGPRRATHQMNKRNKRRGL
jgi:hypothetical protein